MTTPPLSPRHARSFVLVAVLVIVTSAILLATGVLFMAQGRAADAGNAMQTAQDRMLAWSGVQAVMSRLNDQRDRLLAGEAPQLDRQYTIYEIGGSSQAAGNRLGVVRLLPMSGPVVNTSATADEQLFCMESGKVDLNAVDADALARTGLVDQPTAQAIVQHRESLGRPLQSELELLNITGGTSGSGVLITPEMLYGPMEELKPRDQSDIIESDLAERVQDRLGARQDQPRGLLDAVTVYAVEPMLQRSGVLRINLNVPWSEELAQRVTERFGADAANVLKNLFEQGTKFDSDEAIVKTLRRLNVDPAAWPDILDTFTSESGQHHYGRLNINAALQQEWMALPGITEELAMQLVSARGQLSEEHANTICWPVLAGILTPEQFEPLAARLTTRSWTYRIRLAAGEVNADEPEQPLNNPVILEAVIDCSDPTPRVAYLRDITVLQAAAQVALQSTASQPPEFLTEGSNQPEPPASESTQPTATEIDEASPPVEAPTDEEAAADSEAVPGDEAPTSGVGSTPSTATPASGTVSGAAGPSRRRVGRWLGGG